MIPKFDSRGSLSARIAATFCSAGMIKIKNDRQLAATKKWRASFQEALAKARQNSRNLHPRLHQAQVDGIRSQIKDLDTEIAEYQALRRSEQDLRGDVETQQKLEKISTLAKQVDTVIAQGQMPDEATTLEYETAVRDLETSSIGQRYVTARANFEKLMVKVNEQISAGMEKGASSSIITLG